MGFITGAIIYKLGKRRGRKSVPPPVLNNFPNPRVYNCVNYKRFCEQYGSCAGQKCEFVDA
jgi:hypothetical protein